ncbi:hypothetical protein RFI_11053 [Reticulomyxa filosa]|uniref:Uncharacterized protein n=1 Tax=Reticulomyxa filosa TaxID=46433 RepID=X6NL17_RETFI|nr:hypothetical protein RFI_11053 [Reticulomyxa filosa]|eukprot:ETO26082.1 hypothetical protein RFI_11053 [Reticulomyxa filosa]
MQTEAETKTENKENKKAKNKKSLDGHKHQAKNTTQDFKSRKQSLQVGATQLETVLKELAGDDVGDTALLAVALRQLHIYNEVCYFLLLIFFSFLFFFLVTNSLSICYTIDKSTLPAYMESIIPNISDDKGQINYKLMCAYLSDPTATQSLPNNDQWNAFRESMIGQARKSDHLRIHYCLDGWPASKILELDNYSKLAEAAKHNNQIELLPLIPLILNSLGKDVEFAEFRVKTGYVTPKIYIQ